MRSAGEVFGLVLIVVGVIVLLGTVGADAGLAASLQWLWPLLIVGLGLWLMWEAGNRRRSGPPAGWSSWSTPPPPSAPGTPPPADSWSPAAPPSGAWPPGTGATPAAGDAGPGSAGPGSAGPGSAWSTSASWGAGTSGWGAGAPGAEGPSGAAGASSATGAAGAPGASGASGWGTGTRAWGPGAFQDRRFLGEIEVAGPLQAGPMRIETFIGEIRLDLTQATFPDGETPIHVSTAIGEVRVLLPADIPTSVRATSLLGESEALGRVSGAFMGDARAETDDYATATKRIRLEAQSLIGDVAVRRARAAGAPDPMRAPAAPAPPDPSADSAVPGAADRFAPPAAGPSAPAPADEPPGGPSA